ncbi:Uncharacterised protein [Parabacteroides distasonis]|uniref:Uncharacterized protein n=1 Tax=Parabacteroides distasonis TaxID=823 RepID=A0A6N3CW67_PARDI
MSGRLYDTLISLWFRKETHGAGPYCTTARSYNPIFSQFLVQGSPADAEYPGCTGTVALRLFKGPEKQLFFLFLRNGGGFLPSDGEVQIQFLR